MDFDEQVEWVEKGGTAGVRWDIRVPEGSGGHRRKRRERYIKGAAPEKKERCDYAHARTHSRTHTHTPADEVI